MATDRGESQVDDVSSDEREGLEAALCVLAGSDPENCSYSRGYVKRQAVFACNTCTPTSAQPAGMCLACANQCHDGHDIYELYTKRNFRCDCGNSKFGDFKCQLMTDKDQENVRNHYNHNYRGLYCTCDRPYPDTDDQVNDEMIQCVICEDWFHSRHLGCSVVDTEELQEMVCETCMNKAPFLWTYAAHFAESPVISVSHEEGEVEVEEGGESEASEVSGASGEEEASATSVEDTKEETGPVARLHGAAYCKRAELHHPPRCHGVDVPAERLCPQCRVQPCLTKAQEVGNVCSPGKRTHEQMTGGSREEAAAAATNNMQTCRLKELQARGRQRQRQGAVFWPYSWRSELCTCTSCKRAYVSAEVHFLMDQSDTVLAYENRGMEEPLGQHPLMALTSSMDRVQQLEIIYSFNDMTTSINAFLDQCVAEGKSATAEAIHQLFEELQARKRRRTNAEHQ